MQLGEIIRGFSEEAPANEALLACNDIVLFAQVGEAAGRFQETVGEYAAGAVRRFANLAVSEDSARADERDRAGERSRHRLSNLHDPMVAEARRDTAGARPRRLHLRRERRLHVNRKSDRNEVAVDSRGLARVGILVISDRASRGDYNDESGKAINSFLNKTVQSNWIAVMKIVPDGIDSVAKALVEMSDREDCDLVLTTGGTGPSPRDLDAGGNADGDHARARRFR